MVLGDDNILCNNSVCRCRFDNDCFDSDSIQQLSDNSNSLSEHKKYIFAVFL